MSKVLAATILVVAFATVGPETAVADEKQKVSSTSPMNGSEPTASERRSSDASAESLTEVNKQLSNPISTIWALQVQENTYWLDEPERNVVNVQFQPVLPLGLTEDWNLITRPVFQLLNSNPYVSKKGKMERIAGFGDTILATLVSPSTRLAGPWLLAAGPTFIFPTAAGNRLGQNKWQVGPGGLAGYLAEKWIAGVFVQQWFSVGGSGPNEISQMNLQYFFSYFPGDGWAIGTSPNMLVNWYASNENMYTFPVGLNISKVVKLGPLPVKFAVQGMYMPVRPDAFGQKWNLQFAVTPVIPKLIKANLFD